MNWIVLFGAAAIPLLMGMIWYNPKVFGGVWMRELGITEEQAKNMDKSGMWKIFLFVYIFSFLAAMVYMQLCIHQLGVMGAIGGMSELANAKPSYHAFMADYGMTHRSFGHGALHGTIASLFLGLFMVGTSALFEQRSWKYIFIHVGFYTLCGAIMGGIICQFA